MSAGPNDEAAQHVIVFGGGDPPSPQHWEFVRNHSGDTPFIVAADSGAGHARNLGVTPDVAVGDFDSATDATQSWLHRTGTEIRSYAPDKDQSDLELAMEVAMAKSPLHICVLGMGGGRSDHSLLNLMVLADRRWADAQVRGIARDTIVTVVRDSASLRGERGSIVSLLAVGGEATITTEGLLYPLSAERLGPTSARGLSNVFNAQEATVKVAAGVVLALQPHLGRTHRG